MQKLRNFVLPAIFVLTYIMNMPSILFAQGYSFPTDDYGGAYVAQIGNVLQIIGTTRFAEPPPWEELVVFEGPKCAHPILIGDWDCENPVGEGGANFLVYQYWFQIYYDDGCNKDICVYSPMDPEENRICFRPDEHKYAVNVEIQDLCGTALRKRNVGQSSVVDMDEWIQFYAEVRVDDEDVQFPPNLAGAVKAGGNTFPSIVLYKIEEEPGLARYQGEPNKARYFFGEVTRGVFTFEVPYGRMGTYSATANEIDFSVEDDVQFRNDLPIHSSTSMPEACYPLMTKLYFGNLISFRWPAWPSACGMIPATINGYLDGELIISTEGTIEQDEFYTGPAQSTYETGWSFREEILDFDWTMQMNRGQHERPVGGQNNIKIYHAFKAMPIYFYNLPEDNTVEVGDIISMEAVPYPNLKEQIRIEYKWFKYGVGELPGDGTFMDGDTRMYKANSFRADYPGDVELRYKVKDLSAGYESDSPEPHKVLHIRKPRITISSPAPGSQFVYSANVAGVLTIDATATVIPQSLANEIEWSIWNINGSNLTTIPSPPQGNSITFNYANLPSDNDEFGEKYIIASIPAYDVAESVLVKVFYKKMNSDNPAGLTPNWYYYWSQTIASTGTHVYDPNTNKVGYYLFSEYHFYIGHKASLSSGVVCAMDDFDGIDLFAATCLHENEHQSYYDLWWRPIGGYLPNRHLDNDDDRCLDLKEPNLVPPLDPTLKVTYPAGYGDVSNFDDFEYLGYEKECDWIKGKADTLDWASPGHQY